MPRKNEYDKIAEQNVVKLAVDNTQLKRPTAPKHLSDAEKKIWKETVSGKPLEHFQPDSLVMLEEYCKRLATLNRFYEIRNAFYEYNKDIDLITDKDVLANADKLQLMISREFKAVKELSLDLRLTNKPNAKVETVPAVKKKPWEK